MTIPVALAQDHIVQPGGAERVLASMVTAFPDAPLYTTFFRPELAFPIFSRTDVRPFGLNRIALLRNHHRAMLPIMAPTTARIRVDADVVICGSAGWGQGIEVTGRKIVYFHALAAWLHAPDRYLAGRGLAPRLGLGLVRRPLEKWDRRTATSADRHLVYGPTMQRRVREVFGIEADVLPPSVVLDATGPEEAIAGVEPGYVLCVARLMPYKNVDAILAAFERLPAERLVVAGDGQEAAKLRRVAPRNARFVGAANDVQLRWLYRNCRAVVAAGWEAYGLTPVEAAVFGKATVALGQGGLVDTVTDGATGVLFPEPDGEHIATAIRRLDDLTLDHDRLRALVDDHTEARFVERIRAIVASEQAIA